MSKQPQNYPTVCFWQGDSNIAAVFLSRVKSKLLQAQRIENTT